MCREYTITYIYPRTSCLQPFLDSDFQRLRPDLVKKGERHNNTIAATANAKIRYHHGRS
jgi:hypothetical protein